MELIQTSFNRFGSRKVFIEESIQDPRTNAVYTRKIISEESYVPGQCLYLNTINVENRIHWDNNAVTKCDNTLTSSNNFNPNCDTLCEETPMEVDLNSSKDELFNTIHRIEENHLRNRKPELKSYRNIETTSSLVPLKKPLISGLSKILILLVGLLILTAIYFIIAGEHFVYVDKRLQVENLKSDLKQTLHHQDEALDVIIKNIERMTTWNKGIRVLPFIGTTGVGKTLTANVIKKHFFPQLVHEITNLNEQQNIIHNLHSCCCNLIIVDNLKACDLNNFLGFIEKLPKSHDILVIPIFNIHDTTDGVVYYISEEDFKLIRERFDASNLYYDLVIYDVLDYHVIEKWLRKELHKKQIDESKHEALVQHILDRDDVQYKGFKSLDLKLLLSLKE